MFLCEQVFRHLPYPYPPLQNWQLRKDPSSTTPSKKKKVENDVEEREAEEEEEVGDGDGIENDFAYEEGDDADDEGEPCLVV